MVVGIWLYVCINESTIFVGGGFMDDGEQETSIKQKFSAKNFLLNG